MIKMETTAPSPAMPQISRSTCEKRRTLRTYSKRSRSAEDDATSRPAKKQKAIAEETPIRRRPEPPRLPPSPPTPTLSHTSNIPKSSILSYFKPCRSSSATESSDPLSNPEKLVDTPPSSPPIVRRIREPRRLRLRPSTAILSFNVVDVEEQHKDADRSKERLVRRTTRSSKQADREKKQEASESKLNVRRESPRGESLSKSNVHAKAATVQTTINISSKPTFEECKTCRMVYNPLHPPDVKYHAQRHTASLRSRSKA